MNDIVKIGNVELTRTEAEQIYKSGKFILTYSKVYQVMYSPAQQKFYGHAVINQGGAKRGRFHVMSAEEINHLFKKEILQEVKS